jgi:cystathionine beta-synthase
MEGKMDAFVAGAGTGGTISGVGRFLKEKDPKIQIVLADPVGSILYDLVTHGKVRTEPKPYFVEGVGEDMIPDNFHKEYIDTAIQVNDQEAFSLTRRLVAEEGLCVGPSSALNLVAALKWAKTHSYAKRILVVFPDSGRAYLSKAFNEQWLKENNLL